VPSKYPVIELFGPTIQGEGALAGVKSHFLRFGGCPYRCKWCDSLHAVIPEQIKAIAKPMTTPEILAAVLALPPSPWVTLTGGDPVMWDLEQLVCELAISNINVNVETEGFLWRDWLKYCPMVTVSPKPPSSGMEDKLDVELLNKYIDECRRICIKVVVFDEIDYHWAIGLQRLLGGRSMHLSVGTHQKLGDTHTKELIMAQMTWLYEKVANDPLANNFVVLPQLHVLAWGTKQGV
jgi:7-carboxy-7-deazaguanine synthase